MIKKRGKFLTFIFSLLPGAGHLYMGFMKLGVSIMSIFFALVFFSSWLNIGPLLFVLPVLWFYSFFDAINKSCLSDEEFYTLEDHYFIPLDSFSNSDGRFFTKNKLFFGIALAILGGFLLWNNLWEVFDSYFPAVIRNLIYRINSSVPQLLVGVLILIIGIRMILGKKRGEDTRI